jgi:chitinase
MVPCAPIGNIGNRRKLGRLTIGPQDTILPHKLAFGFRYGGARDHQAIHTGDFEERFQAVGGARQRIPQPVPLAGDVQAQNGAQSGRIHIWHRGQVDDGQWGGYFPDGRLEFENVLQGERPDQFQDADSITASGRWLNAKVIHPDSVLPCRPAQSGVQYTLMEAFRMSRFSAGLGVCIWCGLAMLPAHAQQPTQKRLVADYGYWSRTQTPPYSSAQIPFGMLTQINHAGVNFNADGSLSVPPPPDGFLEPALISKAHAAGVKVLLLLGGDFTGLETTTGGLKTLLANLHTFITKNGYDGLDIDWEYPASTTDTQTFYALMTGLREIFPSPTYLLSADVPPWGGTGYDVVGLESTVDYWNVMMYDCAGPWPDDGQLNSPIFWNTNDPEPWECQPGGSAEQAATIFLNDFQVPASKLNMGTPFYGYFYTDVSAEFGACSTLVQGNCPPNGVPSVNYGTFIKQRIDQLGWTAYYDQIALVPYLLRSDGQPGYITYDDAFSTYTRISYSEWQRGLGGGFMWSLDADYDGHSQDLLEAMYQATMNLPYTAPKP